MITTRAKKLSVFCLCHFIVDFACAFLLFSSLRNGETWIACLLIYNFFAFALQMPIGILADRLMIDRTIAVGGMMIVAFSYFLTGSPFVMCAIAGLGNALFHVGTGRDILVTSGGKYTYPGIFVAPGAMGLSLGMFWGVDGGLTFWSVPFILVGVALSAHMLCSPSRSEATAVNGLSQNLQGIFAPALLLFAVVVIRSVGGTATAFPWKHQGDWAATLVVALALGKAFGGILADRFGARPIAAISLLLSGALLFFYKQPILGVLSVFLFNMTMPITLGLIYELLPDYPGFSFGITTFGLFLGFLPAALGEGLGISMPFLQIGLCVISALLILPASKEPVHET